jgi:hypothetical protein
MFHPDNVHFVAHPTHDIIALPWDKNWYGKKFLLEMQNHRTALSGSHFGPLSRDVRKTKIFDSVAFFGYPAGLTDDNLSAVRRTATFCFPPSSDSNEGKWDGAIDAFVYGGVFLTIQFIRKLRYLFLYLIMLGASGGPIVVIHSYKGDKDYIDLKQYEVIGIFCRSTNSMGKSLYNLIIYY